MRFASIAELKKALSTYLAHTRQSQELLIVTRYGKPYVLIQAITERDVDHMEWKSLAYRRLRRAWEKDDALYDYL